MAAGVRVAMWSGPRNISTAMMRSFGNRPDCFVSDEPFYAHYLEHTGKDHPGREEIIAHHESDWRKVAGSLGGPIPEGKALWYQKHMSHHLLPHMEREWMLGLRHALLIRAPAEMLASLAGVLEEPVLADTGLPQQVELYEWLETRAGRKPPVVDSRDVLEDPRGSLVRLCRALAIEFDESMLSWPAGPRATDGIWAQHWYASVERSTGFEPYQVGSARVPARFAALLERCEGLYARLHAQRLA